MTVTISRWGNSLGIRIPKHALEAANLHEGDKVVVTADGGRLVMSPATSGETLIELLDRITPENRHSEKFAEPMGNEV